jgi:propanediol dehydratase large subunit
MKYLLFVFVIFISCNNKSEVQTLKNKNGLFAELVLPDTVYINEKYSAHINYKNDLDTITTRLDDINKYRIIDYYFTTTDRVLKSDKDLLKIVNDTAYADNNTKIPIYKIIFKKLGKNYIDGIIKDEVIIAKGGILKDGTMGDRIITHEARLTKAVYVIERKRNVSKQMASFINK